MSFRSQTLASRGFVVASLAAFSLFGYGCGGSNHYATLSGQFTASATPVAVDLIKLVPQAASGARVVVQAVIYGPTTSLDMYSFAFDVKIGDPTVLKFVPNSAVAGNALIASAVQTIQFEAGPDLSDPSRIVVGVSKFGGGSGNGVAGASSIIVSLAFDVIKQGTSTLAISTAPHAPTVLDHNGLAIVAITFDPLNGFVTGISTGGGGY